MIQCQDCPHFHRNEQGQVAMSCDPFSTIVEPECLQKWQLLKTSQLVASYQATLEHYRRLAPMQEKMFKVMEREIDDMNEAERWKIDDEDEEEPLW
jgi:predicted LPLAT superfamily acyltransferase